jgi:hypothetical protein
VIQQFIDRAIEERRRRNLDLPLAVLDAIANVKSRGRKCLEGCCADPNPWVARYLLNIDDVKEIMLATAVEFFLVRSNFYESRPGLGREWQQEAIEDAVNETFRLVPLEFLFISEYLNAKPEIREGLEAKLEKLAALRPSAAAASSKPADPFLLEPRPGIRRTRGRPMKIPIEAKEQALRAKGSGATGKQIAQIIYGGRYPTRDDVKNAGSILAYYERSRKGTRS